MGDSFKLIIDFPNDNGRNLFINLSEDADEGKITTTASIGIRHPNLLEYIIYPEAYWTSTFETNDGFRLRDPRKQGEIDAAGLTLFEVEEERMSFFCSDTYELPTKITDVRDMMDLLLHIVLSEPETKELLPPHDGPRCPRCGARKGAAGSPEDLCIRCDFSLERLEIDE